jgi:hypothetical protein
VSSLRPEGGADGPPGEILESERCDVLRPGMLGGTAPNPGFVDGAFRCGAQSRLEGRIPSALLIRIVKLGGTLHQD